MRRTVGLGLLGCLGLLVACSASSGGPGGSGGASSGSGTGGDDDILTTSGSGTTPCLSKPHEDADGDGYTGEEGDCNDCNPYVNPNAFDVAGNGVDEDCDGSVDNPPAPCDSTVPIDEMDPMAAARSVELCKVSTSSNEWGIVEAKWVLPDGNAAPGNANFHLGHGVLDHFGPSVQPQGGSRMLGVSSGTARASTHPGYQSPAGFDKSYSHQHPQGFPKESPSCGNAVTGGAQDGTALEVKLRAPSNAQSYSFFFNFYTYEWPGYVCTTYNDFFIAIQTPMPSGQSDGHVSFDTQGNPVSVNNAFVEVCGSPGTYGGKYFECQLGGGELSGTGFESGAATSWLVTTVPIQPGQEFSLRWGTYDSGDGVLDSTTLVDNFQWGAEEGEVVTKPVVPK